MLQMLPESAERDARELTLTLALGQTLGLTRGFSAAETVETYSRARALSERIGAVPQTCATLIGLSTAALGTGDYESTQRFAEQALELAQRYTLKEGFLGAHGRLAWARFYRADLANAEEHYLKLCAVLDQEGLEAGTLRPSVLGVRTVQVLGVGPRVAAYMGNADTARARGRELIKLAQQFQYPYDLTNAQTVLAIVYASLGEFEETEKWAAQAVAIADEHGFPFFAGYGRVLDGYAMAQSGLVAEGIATIHQGLEQGTAIRSRLARSWYLALLAEVQALAGQLNDALQTVEEALQANPQELVFRPHILQVRGELQLRQGRSKQAEEDFREAIALAQKMGAKASELRAAISLVRMLQARGDSAQARELLAPLYGWFTEGFDTPNLKAAKALLDQLPA
jgi:tetratricopeptide (TPR) repeat protein